jgi:hypothetical protein
MFKPNKATPDGQNSRKSIAATHIGNGGAFELIRIEDEVAHWRIVSVDKILSSGASTIEYDMCFENGELEPYIPVGKTRYFLSELMRIDF